MSEIFKLQLSMASSEDNQQVLIYNKNETIRYQTDATDILIKDFFGGGKSFKTFAKGKYNKRTQKIELHGHAPWQDW